MKPKLIKGHDAKQLLNKLLKGRKMPSLEDVVSTIPKMYLEDYPQLNKSHLQGESMSRVNDMGFEDGSGEGGSGSPSPSPSPAPSPAPAPNPPDNGGGADGGTGDGGSGGDGDGSAGDG